MEDFNSKYTGEQVEELLDIVANGETGGGGGITAETDPVFLASPAASITDAKKEEWDNKVDKVNGKQLSTEDFTTALKAKLEGLSNYDDTEIENALSSLQTQFDTLVSGNASDAINSFNEIIAFLEGIQDTQDLSSIIASIEQQIADKQDAISDLETIRDGASIWTKVEGEAGVRLKGTNGTATGNSAISAGDDKTASDGTPFPSVASGDHAVAFGYGNTCSGRSTLAQGLYNTVNGKDSVAFGQRNTVNGDQAFAAGQQNEVTTRLGVAIGYKNKATNTDSIAIGYQNTSSGSASVAMGDTCEAGGTSSTAMGYKTKATGAYSSTFGQNTQATNEGEVAMGLYNKSTTSTDAAEQTMFSFGIGTSDTNRANALEIKKNGDVYIGDKLLSVEDFMTAEDLAAVATSGDYNDLTNKPIIPAAVTESTVSGWGFTKNTGTYSKPSGGIPQSDLSEEVNVALRDAIAYKGTVTGVKYNNSTKMPTDGIVDLGTVGTYSKPSTGIPKSDLTSSVQTSLGKADTAVQPADIKDEVYIADFTMESLRVGVYNGTYVDCDTQGLVNAMNANKVILVREGEDSLYQGVYVLNGFAEDLLYFSIVGTDGDILWCEGTDYLASQYIDGSTLHIRSWGDKQDTLVSGENIKTINGESILGSGDIEISGGSGEQGPKGEDGVGIASVKQTTTSSADGGTNVVTVTLSNGTTSTFNVKNGSKGSNGTNGTNGKDGADGEDGATFTPSVDSAGNLSWSNNKGLTNPPTVNIKGPKGDKGDAGSGGGDSSEKEIVDATNGVIEVLEPNKIYILSNTVSSLTFEIQSIAMPDGSYAEYCVIIYAESFLGGDVSQPSISLPAYLRWPNGSAPDITKTGIYELNIVYSTTFMDSSFNAVLTPFQYAE